MAINQMIKDLATESADGNIGFFVEGEYIVIKHRLTDLITKIPMGAGDFYESYTVGWRDLYQTLSNKDLVIVIKQMIRAKEFLKSPHASQDPERRNDLARSAIAYLIKEELATNILFERFEQDEKTKGGNES